MGQAISWFRETALDELRAIPFKPVDREIVRHSIERRGFVSVPLDYSRPEGPKADIFYRLIPAAGTSVAEASRPTVVVVNGGPGMPSSLYRPYDFDYSGERPAKVDYLGELGKHFRVLILDQRGTDGNSCPLDLDDPRSRPEIIARYFDSRHVALDHQEIINRVLPGEPFFMIAQSYGGMVGMHYMSLPEIRRLPQGICFSSAAMPHGDFLSHSHQRRAKQKELNLQLWKSRPDLIPKILELRGHFRDRGLAPDSIHYLWNYLGQGEDGHWESKLGAKLDSLLASDGKGLKDFVAEEDGCNFLNYILSGPMMTPGHTDAILARAAAEALPYDEPWMLDECRILQAIGRDGTWRQAAIEAMDANPHPGLPYPSPKEIQRGFSRSRVLFSLALGDIYLPLEGVRENARRFSVPGVTSEIVLPGGHKAIFLPKGVKAFLDWTRSSTLRARRRRVV
ncbi:MAG: alpha/beta fold hydrolase [Elusimicrobia bacterium]|nr:alpha/beta fold hydrolase [Elusimicrobiota bacterium]